MNFPFRLTIIINEEINFNIERYLQNTFILKINILWGGGKEKRNKKFRIFYFNKKR